MTEDDMMKKACPKAAGFNASNGGRQIIGGNSVKADRIPTCIGSACAAWRWETGARVWRLNAKGEKLYSFPVADARQFETDPEFRVEPRGTDGYCGLAGAPA